MVKVEQKAIFLTGVTGTLGKEFVKETLLTRDEKLYLLIRRKNRHSHWDRARKILSGYGLENLLGTRVEVFEGDVTLPHFGLGEEDLRALRRDVVEFFHIAALTTLNASKEDCNRINVGGATEAIKLAQDLKKNGQLKRFFYFSTAYVSGSRQTFHAPEDTLTEKPAHANFYESSKYESEGLVRRAMAKGLPTTIFRPSIVVGDSRTGQVSEFNVIYPFMKLFAHGILKVLPTQAENAFNIVPIDFVIQSSSAISKQESSIGKTFHLVTKEPPAIGTLLQLKDVEYPEIPKVEIIPPEKFKKENLDPMSQNVFSVLEPYLGYLNDNLTFQTANTEKALEGTGVSFPKTDYEFLKTLIRYAVDSGYLVVGH